ncbi:MAG: ABC transporter permease [Bullifex sp.]|nr:ABC transporter permease [Bullifex sp.]MDY5908423.1 ABC transporter permease [Bullifex sp.]
MGRYVTKRLLSALAVLFFVTLITFLVLSVIPGDQAVLSLGLDATSESIEALRASMGLDRPFYVRYLEWLFSAITFDFGTSAVYGESVTSLIASRIPVTFSLTLFSIAVATVISALLGLFAALARGKGADGIIRTAVMITSSLPSFWISLLALIFFCGHLGWFPVNGYISPAEGFAGFLRSITLPSFILAAGELALMTRMFRSSLVRSLSEDYMMACEVKGLSRARALFHYAGRSAIIAPITLIGNQAAKLFGGTVIVETVFSLPGIGRLLLVAVEQRDTALLQGVVLFITFMVVLMNLLTDIAVAAADPMIRLGEEGGR